MQKISRQKFEESKSERAKATHDVDIKPSGIWMKTNVRDQIHCYFNVSPKRRREGEPTTRVLTS